MAIRAANVVLISLVAAFIGASIVVYPAYPNITLAVTGICLLVSLVLKKNMTYSCFLTVPFALFSFVPSDYVYNFRLPTPIGYLSPVFLIVLLQLAVVAVVFHKNSLGHLRQYKPLLLWMFVFFMFSFISALFNGVPITGYKSLFKDMTLSLGMVVLLNWRHEINKLNAIKIAIFMSTIVSAFAISEYFWGFQPYLDAYLSSTGTFDYQNDVVRMDVLRRSVSTIGNPLVLAGYLMIPVPFILYLRGLSKSKLTWNAVLIAHTLAIILTFSRTAIAILAAIYLFWLFKNRSIKQVVSGIALIGTVGIIAYFGLNALAVSDNFIDRLLFNGQQYTGSYTSRFTAYQVILDILSRNPLIGIGYGNNPSVLAGLISSNGLNVPTYDNAFLEVLSDRGLIGLVLLFMVYLALRKAFATMAADLRFVGYMVILILVGFSFSYYVEFFEAVWGTAWFFIGALLMLGKRETQQ